MPTIKVSLLGDTATQFLATAIKGEGIERGYNIDLFEAEYNQVERQVLDPTSDLYTHDAKYTVVFQSTHKLLEQYSLMPASDWNTLADERINFIRTIFCHIIKRLNGDFNLGIFEVKVFQLFLYG